MMGVRAGSVTCMLVAAVALTGCSSSSDGSASARARDFYQALAAKDAHAACADLAAEARKALEQQEHKSCTRVILGQGLPTTPGPARADVYGSGAQVRGTHDTAFLSRYGDGWRITAVGCKPTGTGQPYDCTIEVG